jgi:hypothetical protein
VRTKIQGRCSRPRSLAIADLLNLSRLLHAWRRCRLAMMSPPPLPP